MRTRFGIIGCGGAALPVAEAIVTSPLTQLARVYGRPCCRWRGPRAKPFGGRCSVPDYWSSVLELSA